MIPDEQSSSPSPGGALTELQRECAARWHLTLESAYPGSGSARAIRARRVDGTPVVLKLSPSPCLADEAQALVHWNGAGAVRLLASDLPRGALLLERVEPGIPLASLCAEDDRVATAEAARLMRGLHGRAAEDTGLPGLADWIEALEQTIRPETPPALQREGARALRVGRELLASSASGFVLHGDLHHHNILRAQRAPWVAIDPKGVLGPREADAAALVRNPRSFVLSHARPEDLVRARIEVIAEITGLEAEALRLWGWALAVVAAWWSFEDSETEWARWLACAQAIQRSG